MELYAGIRRAVMVDGLSRREAAQRFGVHRNTISKMLQFSVPPGYRRRERSASKKLGPYMAWIYTRHARRWCWRALRRPPAGEVAQRLCDGSDCVDAASDSPNAFYGYFGGSGAGGQVPDCCGLGRALHRCWRYQRSAPAQARKALWPVLGGSVSTGGRGRAPGWIWPSGAQPVIRKLSLPPLGA